MKTRTLGVVAGMVLVAASAGLSQAAGLDKEVGVSDAFSTNAANGVPAILGSFDNASAYQTISKQEMKNIQGEHTYALYIRRATGQIISIKCISTTTPVTGNRYVIIYV